MTNKLHDLKLAEQQLEKKRQEKKQKQDRQNLISSDRDSEVKALGALEFCNDVLREEKLRVHMELVRRKLDFEVIKDNFENRATQEILDKFTDVGAGLPGT